MQKCMCLYVCMHACMRARASAESRSWSSEDVQPNRSPQQFPRVRDEAVLEGSIDNKTPFRESLRKCALFCCRLCATRTRLEEALKCIQHSAFFVQNELGTHALGVLAGREETGTRPDSGSKVRWGFKTRRFHKRLTVTELVFWNRP